MGTASFEFVESSGKIVEVKVSGVLHSSKGPLENPFLSALNALFIRAFFMLTTYILKSLKDHGYYFGHCSDMEARLLRHNQCEVRSTKSRVPFVIHYQELFQTKSEAYRRELFFKSYEGRQWLKSNKII